MVENSVLRYVGLATLIGCFHTQAACSQEFKPLKVWVNGYFDRTTRTCLAMPKVNSPKIEGSPTPENVRKMLAADWEKSVPVYENVTLRNFFSKVYELKDGQANAVGGSLATPFPQSSATAFYEDEASARQQYNCATLFSAKAGLKVELGLLQFRALLDGTTSENQTQTLFAYSGRFISPIASALALNAGDSYLDPDVSPLSVRLALWRWYQVNPQWAADPGNLRIYGTMRGVALYRVAGITQDRLLSGKLNVSSGIPFLNASGKADGSFGGDFKSDETQFGAAITDYDYAKHLKTLPSPQEVAESAPSYADIVPVEPDQRISDSRPFVRQYDLNGVPSAFCQNLGFKLDPSTADASPGAATARATLSELRVAPEGDVGTTHKCRFRVTVTPPPASQMASTDVRFTVRASLPPSAGANMPAMVFTHTASLVDMRSSVGLNPGSGPAGAVEGTRLSVVYRVRDAEGRRVTGALTPSVMPSVTCGSGAPRALPIDANDVTISIGAGGVKDVTLSVRLPADLVPPEPAAQTAQCRLDGTLSLAIDAVGIDPVTLGLPTYGFSVSRAPPGAKS